MTKFALATLLNGILKGFPSKSINMVWSLKSARMPVNFLLSSIGERLWRRIRLPLNLKKSFSRLRDRSRPGDETSRLKGVLIVSSTSMRSPVKWLTFWQSSTVMPSSLSINILRTQLGPSFLYSTSTSYSPSAKRTGSIKSMTDWATGTFAI